MPSKKLTGLPRVHPEAGEQKPQEAHDGTGDVGLYKSQPTDLSPPRPATKTILARLKEILPDAIRGDPKRRTIHFHALKKGWLGEKAAQVREFRKRRGGRNS
jgi:hypothetical protein